MKKLKYILSLTILFSCSQAPKEIESGAEVESNANTEQAKTEEEPEEKLNKTIVLGDFEGKIGKNLEVKFRLKNNAGNVSGYYYYEKNGVDIKIVGKVYDQKLVLQELTYTNDTLAYMEATIVDSVITGKWVHTKTKVEHNLKLQKAKKEIFLIPSNITGTYKDENCNLTLIISKAKGEYFYKYISDERTLKGKVSFGRGEETYLTLDNIEYAEDYFDISLPEEDEERQKEYDQKKKIGKRQMGVEGFLDKDELIIQNTGNAMNYYVKLYDCDEKYIHLKRQ